MAKSKNDTAQTGVTTETSGNVAGSTSAGETSVSTSGVGSETSGGAPVGTENSNFGGGAIETNEKAGEQTATEAGNAPEAGTEGGSQAGTENAPEGEGKPQSEGEPAAVSMEDLTRKPKNLSEVPLGERPLAQHAEEVAVRNEAAVAEGGEETVATGIHKGRKIVNGVIDFSTASDREKTIAANKKAAKENLANEAAEPAGEEKKAA